MLCVLFQNEKHCLVKLLVDLAAVTIFAIYFTELYQIIYAGYHILKNSFEEKDILKN